ncbi:MAG: hypothetical protein ACOCU6_01825 [Nanoarchaeota archaeon]
MMRLKVNAILLFSHENRRSKKGQVALEYMTTYGWALLVIIASIGILAHFGFLNPSKYIPESCEFGEQLQCRDHSLTSDGELKFRFKNNFEADINVTAINITNKDNAIKKFSSKEIPKGEIKKVNATIDTDVINDNVKTNLKVTLTFRRTGGTIDHNISGTVYTKMIEEDLLT